MSTKKAIKRLLQNACPPKRKVKAELKRIVRECNNGDK